MKLVTLAFALGIILTVVTPTMAAPADKATVFVTYYNAEKQEYEEGIYSTGDCMATSRSPTRKASFFRVNANKSECQYYEDASCSKKAAIPLEELGLEMQTLRLPDSYQEPLSFKCFVIG